MAKGCSPHHRQLLQLAAWAKQQQADFSPAKQEERHRGTEQLPGKAGPFSSHPLNGKLACARDGSGFVLVFRALLRGNGKIGAREPPARQELHPLFFLESGQSLIMANRLQGSGTTFGQLHWLPELEKSSTPVFLPQQQSLVLPLVSSVC